MSANNTIPERQTELINQTIEKDVRYLPTALGVYMCQCANMTTATSVRRVHTEGHGPEGSHCTGMLYIPTPWIQKTRHADQPAQAINHGNQPSRGAKIDKELQEDDEAILKKKGDAMPGKH